MPEAGPLLRLDRGGLTPARGDIPVLWQYSFSNYNEKVRWALDIKRVVHRRHSLMPGGPKAMAFSRRGGTLPVLDLDGERIVDSTRIIEALEGRYPDPPLYPSDPDQRRQALELEEFFDEHAGHDMRRVGFWEARKNLDYALDFMTAGQSGPSRLAGRAGFRAAFPIAWRYMSRRYEFTKEAVERSRETLAAALDRIESERDGGDYLVGGSFTVADLTAAALLYPMVWPREYPYELPEPPSWEFLEPHRDHPALGWITETWRRHRGASAAV